MDSSKFGWRAPSDECLEAITARWPDHVQVVVDACQMRLGRPRLQQYLSRGYLVIVTGSKFFTGPPFSGALLVPSEFASSINAISVVPEGLFEYVSRSDWPQKWRVLRERFPARSNFGQWLRWEAAIEEIGAYYRVPDCFRRTALETFSAAVERLIGASPSLDLLPWQKRPLDEADEEMAERTIFSFAIRRGDGIASLSECRTLYRALAGHAGPGDLKPATRDCLIGQPVALGASSGGNPPPAALRISASARLISEAWTPDAETADRNLQRAVDQAAVAIANLEAVLAELDGLKPMDASHGW
jgi:hypothetical protein